MTTEPERTVAARLAWATTKLTGAGRHPVPVARLAAEVGVSAADARRLAASIGFTLDGEAVVMAWPPAGERRYLVRVGDRVLDSGRGCSVDVFLLAIATGEPVKAESTCPATGKAIRVELTADTVVHVDPPTAVVATVDLAGVDLTAGLEQVDAAICAHQPFFASADAAAGWLAEHRGGRVYPVSGYLERARLLVAALEDRSRP
jgi:alkylmercury lyase